MSRCSSPMPLMMVCPLSASMPTLKVGSSLVNLFRAFENAPEDSLFFGATARLMTGSGTVMLVIAYLHAHTWFAACTVCLQQAQCACSSQSVSAACTVCLQHAQYVCSRHSVPAAARVCLQPAHSVFAACTQSVCRMDSAHSMTHPLSVQFYMLMI